MGIIKKLRKNRSVDFEDVTPDNVQEYIDAGKLVNVPLVAIKFGGSDGPENRIVVTPRAAAKKNAVDKQLEEFLLADKLVKGFHCDLEYKGKSLVPAKIVITATIDDEPYDRIIDIW